MSEWELAQFNLSRAVAPLEDPRMEEFVAAIDGLNALADSSPGFVWRLTGDGDGGGSAYLRPYDDATLVNLSVWESVGALRDFTYDSRHRDVMARRREWFVPGSTRMVLWWVPAGHRPSLEEADERLRLLEQDGPTEEAFTFGAQFPPPAPMAATS